LISDWYKPGVNPWTRLCDNMRKWLGDQSKGFSFWEHSWKSIQLAIFLGRRFRAFHMFILMIFKKYTEVKKKLKKKISNSSCFKRYLKDEYKTNHT